MSRLSLNRIAAVNLSNDGTLYGPIVPDSAPACPALSTMVNDWARKLKAYGIAVVVAAGNDKTSAGIGPYACGDEVVAVGSTKVSDMDRLTDGAYGSDASIRTDLLVPVGDAGPGDKIFDGFQGTSTASPQVAGAFAVLRQRYPTETVSQLLARMTSTGTPVTDARPGNVGVTTPRVNLVKALNARGPRPVLDFAGTGKSSFLAANAAGSLLSWDIDPATGAFSYPGSFLASGWTASAHRLSTPVYDYAGPDTNGVIASVGTDLFYYPYDRATQKLSTGQKIATGTAGADVRAMTYFRDLNGPGTGGAVVVQSAATGVVSTLSQQPGSLLLGTPVARLTPTASTDQLVGVADIDGDRRPDLILRDTAKHPVAYRGTDPAQTGGTLFDAASRRVLATESWWSTKDQLFVIDTALSGKPMIGYRVTLADPLANANVVTFPFAADGSVDTVAAAARWGFPAEWTFLSAPQR